MLGGVLQQWDRGGWRPLAFFSKKLASAQSVYSAFDRELLAVYLSIQHFRFMLEGRRFTVFTDHKPLVAAINRVSPPWSARQQRHLAFISEFTTDLQHLPGASNVVADTLSRPPSANPAPVNSVTRAVVAVPLAELAKQQPLCSAVKRLLGSPSLKVVKKLVGRLPVFGDVSTGTFRPLVPDCLRRQVFNTIHGLGHPGMRASRRLISSRYCWAGLAKDVNGWARECVSCQQAKVTRHVSLPPAAFLIPSRRFQHLHVDLVGPLPPSQGNTFIFTIIDRTSRWVEAVPLPSTSAAACATALCSAWVCRFGVPDSLTSDRGPQFTSAVWAALCGFLGTDHSPTTAYHPQSNGMVERWHRRLKDTLRARGASED